MSSINVAMYPVYWLVSVLESISRKLKINFLVYSKSRKFLLFGIFDFSPQIIQYLQQKMKKDPFFHGISKSEMYLFVRDIRGLPHIMSSVKRNSDITE